MLLFINFQKTFIWIFIFFAPDKCDFYFYFVKALKIFLKKHIGTQRDKFQQDKFRFTTAEDELRTCNSPQSSQTEDHEQTRATVDVLFSRDMWSLLASFPLACFQSIVYSFPKRILCHCSIYIPLSKSSPQVIDSMVSNSVLQSISLSSGAKTIPFVYQRKCPYSVSAYNFRFCESSFLSFTCFNLNLNIRIKGQH